MIAKLTRSEYPEPPALARLRHEQHVLSTLSGTGAVQCLGLERYGNGLALLLEDLGNQTLESASSAAANIKDRLRIALECARVIERIHAKGVLHKSIAPQHLFIDSADRVRLIDFGIATFLSQERHAVPAEDSSAALEYIAPEQTGRMNRAIDRRSDLYSLGACFYRLFTGRPPFQARDPLELLHCHLTRTPQPPHELVPDVPEPLSRLVLKLLSKVTEDRYQSAAGLVHDLERILDDLQLSGSAGNLQLGARDFSGEFSLPQRLYGRDAEIATMLRALDRVRSGHAEVLLIAGQSGIGKSALVRELHRYVARDDYFVAGKFEYLKRSIPYAALSQACKELVLLTLAEPPESLAATRQRLELALGPNGRVLTDFLPELEWIIGVQPAVPELGPIETQSRFELVFEQFLGAFASDQRTLVLYLDDLQWADSASLRLLEVALTGSVCTRLFTIGGYRMGEVDDAHPLALFRADLAKRGVSIDQVSLGPLAPHHVSELLADALGTSPAHTARLGSALTEKTGGNPFFLGQLLTSLVHEEVVWFEASEGEWRWDLPKVESSLATENVVQFMLEKLRRLPQKSQEVLRLAACVGHEFDLSTLSEISGQGLSQLARPLWRALEEGLIVPLDGNYRFAELTEGEFSSDLPNAGYRFLHDRVTEAAYALLDENQRRAAHSRIGQLLLAKRGGDANAVFRIADHLNRGSELAHGPEWRRELARLNLEAGQRARAGAAAEVALHYLRRVRDLLDTGAWSTGYELTFSAYLLQAECEQLLGHGDHAFEVLDEAESHARSNVDRSRARNLRSVILTHLSRLHDAVQTCVRTIELLGDGVPRPDDLPALASAIGAEFAACQAARGNREISSLAELPHMTDPVQLALMETYAITIPPAFQSIQDLMVLVVLKATQLSLRSGSAPITPFMYAQYGLVHSIITGDLDVGYQFGELGLHMAQRTANAAHQVAPLFIFGGFLAHWRKPLAESIEQLRLGLRLGLDTGDSTYSCYCAGFIPNYRFYAGESLEEIQASLPGYFGIVERTDDKINRGFLIAVRQAIAALRGETDAPFSLSSSAFSEDEFEAGAVPPVLAFHGAAKALVNLLAGRPEVALEVTETMRPLPNIFYNAEHRVIHALALARLASSAAEPARESLLVRLRDDSTTLNAWAVSCPANHAHRAHLIAAELAALEQRPVDAMAAYEMAIDRARENGFVQYQALACECCASFHLRRGSRRVARAYLEESLYAYKRWGAVGKAAALADEHRELLVGSSQSLERETVGAATRVAAARAGGHLDLATVVRATETIGSELSLGRVLERLMRTLSESAGAQRGFLLLDAAGTMRFCASVSGDPVDVRLGLNEELSGTQQLATGVVQYAARTRNPIVVDDATTDPRFRSDSYVLQRRPRSILCAPLLRRGQIAGILYLENNSTTHGFSQESLELTQFLAAQAAAAVENARLYEELAAATQQLKNSNEHLEQQVADRTRELQSTLSEVWAEMDLAKKIQTVLLPPNQRLKNYEIAAIMNPAESVGGDYYDVVPSADRLWVAIGDVSGHGVTAGLIMMMIQTAIRTLISASGNTGPYSPADVLVRANQAVRSNLERVGNGQYMTITLLEIDGPRVRFAGLHQDLLVYRAARGFVERIETHGVWIGVLEDVSRLLEDESFVLEPGDVVLLYSDGITELRLQGQLLGTEELARRFQLTAREGYGPSAIIRNLIESVADLTANDDVTLLALRYSPDAPSCPPCALRPPISNLRPGT